MRNARTCGAPAVTAIALAILASSAGVSAAVIHVDAAATGAHDGTSWADAYPELQSALAVAQADDEIWVAAGTYRPDYDPAADAHTGDRAATFQLISGVGLYGGFQGNAHPTGGETQRDQRDPEANQVVLSGDLLANDGPEAVNREDNCHHVAVGDGTDANTVLDGFTITGGNANDADGVELRGGGLFIASGSPTILDCRFEGNQAATFGGGVFVQNGRPTLNNCVFIENTAGKEGGGMYNLRSDPDLLDCSFRDNLAGVSGGGMGNQESSPALTECLFAANLARGWYNDKGGGGMNNEKSHPTLTGCTFLRNVAQAERHETGS